MKPRRSKDVSPEHARQVADKVRPMLAYVGALRRRLELNGFPPDDPLFVSTQRAFDALQELHVRLHYLSCTGGVYR